MNRPSLPSAWNSVKRAFESRRLDRFLMAMFVVSLVVVCFVGGAYVAEFDVKWYQRLLKPSFDGLRAVQEKLSRNWKTDGWYKARTSQTGTGDYQPALAYNGLTLYTSMGSFPTAQLISMSGEVVHEWQLPFGKAFEDADGGAPASLEERMHWRRVHLYPNGDLLAIYNVLGETPYGVGMVRIDKDSKLIWKYEGRVHHDFDVGDDGKIYALSHDLRKEPVAAAPHLKTPMLDDFIVVLSPDGKELKKISVFDSFSKSKFAHCLDTIRSDPKGDHEHTNDVDVIHEAFAKHHDFCSAGDVVISLRNPSLLAIVNLKREEVVWAARGIWENQHDPDPLDNGNLLIFDNQGGAGKGGRSRILEWNPANNAIEWCYVGDADKKFDSPSRGCQQLLPNGNVLVTESNNGRILEVTRENKIAWEFNNPHREGKKNELVAVVYSAQRYRNNELNFLTPAELAKADLKLADMAALSKDKAQR